LPLPHAANESTSAELNNTAESFFTIFVTPQMICYDLLRNLVLAPKFS